jgi:predicted dehydrogenase
VEDNTTIETVTVPGGTIKMLVVGGGRQGSEHRAPALRTIPGVEVVGIVDVDLSRAQALAASFNDAETLATLAAVGYQVVDPGLPAPRAYDNVVDAMRAERPDGVVVVVPHMFHAEVTLTALRGSDLFPPAHVLVEKPMATTVADAEAMAAAAAEQRKVLAVGYQNAFAVGQAAEWLRDGRIGELRGINLHWTRESGIPDAPHFWSSREDGGVTPDLAGHLAAPLQVLLGGQDRVVSVRAEAANGFGRTLFGDAFAADDTVVAALGLASGAKVELKVSWMTGQAPDERAGVSLYGTEGEIHQPFLPQKGIGYVPNADDFKAVLRRWGAGAQFGATPPIYVELVKEQTRNWVAAALGREELVLTTDASVDVERVVDAIRRSADEGGALIALES